MDYKIFFEIHNKAGSSSIFGRLPYHGKQSKLYSMANVICIILSNCMDRAYFTLAKLTFIAMTNELGHHGGKINMFCFQLKFILVMMQICIL
jgi:hypothetical protein